MKDTLHGLPGQSLVPRVVKKLNFANVFALTYPVGHRAKEKMKTPKDVPCCRALHQVFCVFDP